MNRIPKKLRQELSEDMFYQRCCVTGKVGTFDDPVQWHHNLIFGGKQVQARFAILPILKSIHLIADYPKIKEKLDWVMVNRMSGEDLELYSKGVDYIHRKEYLNGLFGEWQPWHAEAILY